MTSSTPSDSPARHKPAPRYAPKPVRSPNSRLKNQLGSFGGHSPQPNAHFPLPAAGPGLHTITARGSFGTIRDTRITVTG